MAYFRNTAVNRLNLHYAIHSLALSGGGAFFAAFLLRAGIPIEGVLVTMASILLGRFLIRPSLVGFARRFGLKRMVIAGTVLTALEYPLLAEVNGPGPMLYALVAVAAVADTVYWSSYHAYFAAVGDNEHRGHQIGLREAVAALVGVASPLLTGWLLVAFGPRIAFGVTSLFVIAGSLPLLGAPDVRIPDKAPGSLRAALPSVALFATDGFIAAGYFWVWQMALFLSLGEDVLSFGGAMALSALVGAIGGLVLGRHIDAGHGGRIIWIAYGVMSAILCLRALALRDPAFAVIANAVGALGVCLYIPTLMSAVYSEAKRSPCTLRFHIATEGGWDIGGASGLLIAALLFHLGAPLSAGVLMSAAGVIAGFWMLRRYYSRAPAPA